MKRHRRNGLLGLNSAAAATCETLEARRLLSLSVPALNSLPAATKQIFVDFDGNDAFAWNDGSQARATHGADSADAPIPAFDTDGDSTDFSDGELAEMQTIWASVAEKFSPFNVNVTTVDPGNRSDNVTVQIIVGGSNGDWLGQDVLGISAQGGFQNPIASNTSFVFSEDQASLPMDQRDHVIADRIAHEAGHEFGLVDEHGSTGALYAGNGTIAPIMGDSAHSFDSRGIWWKTNFIAGQGSSDVVRDELQTLTTGAAPLAYRADDVPGINNWQPLSFRVDGSIAPIRGVVGTLGDVDSFSFSASTSVAFTTSNVSPGAMLSPDMKLFDLTQGAFVSAQTLRIDSQIQLSATGLNSIHAYRLDVFGTQNYQGSSAAYGNLGQYTLSGGRVLLHYFDPATKTLHVNGDAIANRITLSVVSSRTDAKGALRYLDTNASGAAIDSMEADLSTVDSVVLTLGAYGDVLTVNPLRTFNNTGAGPTVSYDGGAGADALVLPGNASLHAPYNIVDDAHIVFVSTDITFASAERVEARPYAVDTVIDLHQWGTASTLYIYGTSAVDELFVYSPAIEHDSGFVHFDGAGGSQDNILLDSGLNETGHQFSLFTGEVTVDSGALAFDYTNVEALYVNGSTGDDLFDLYTLPASLRLTIYGNAGNDTLNVGQAFYGLTLTDAAGPIYFTGGDDFDSIVLDDQAAGGTRTYSIGSQTIVSTGGGGTLNYASDTESIILYGALNFQNQFNVSGGNLTTTLSLVGGANSDAFSLIGVAYNMNINGGNGNDTLVVDDRSGVGNPAVVNWYPDSIDRDYGGASPVTTIDNYAGIEAMTYYAGTNTRTANLYGTPVVPIGYSYFLQMSSGNDAITAYPHDALGAIAFPTLMNVVGASGIDTFTIDDSASPVPASYRAISGGFGALNVLIDGFYRFTESAETLTIRASDADDTFTLDSISNNTAIALFGNDGDDTFNVTPTSKDVSISLTSVSSIAFDGGAGNDALRVFDQNSAFAWTETLTTSALSLARVANAYHVSFAYADTETIFASGGTLADNFVLTSAPAGTTLQIDGAAGLDNVSLNAGAAAFLTSQDLAGVTLASGAWLGVSASSDALIRANTLSIADDAQFDLNDADLIVKNTPQAMIETYIRNAYNFGGWDGAGGLFSSAARNNPNGNTMLGLLSGAEFANNAGSSSFDGVSTSNSDVLVKYTYFGDVDFNGAVDSTDYNLIDFGFVSSASGWANGDVDYSGAIDSTDYNLIDFAFLTQAEVL